MKAQTGKEFSLAILATVLLALAASQMHAQSPPSASPNDTFSPFSAVQPPQASGVIVEPVPLVRAVPTQISLPDGGNALLYVETADANDPRTKSLQGLNALLKQLKESTEENRPEITKKVEAALTEYFELDMKHRKEELDRLTKRADDTEARLKKRQDSRAELIDLQQKAYEQNAKGLGLFGEQGRNPLSIRYTTATVGMPGNFVRGRRPMSEKEDSLENAMNQIRSAQNKLDAAKTDEEKADAVKELNAALGAYFDRDMEQKQEDLVAVREDLKEMQAKLKTRTDSKAEIVALQLKIFVNEADGLGFFTNGTNRHAGMSGMFGGGMSRGVRGFGSASAYSTGTTTPVPAPPRK